VGMLQAMLLDRIAPEWEKKIFKENIYLEDLLKANVNTGVFIIRDEVK
jgi:hypothetical protein